MTKRKLLQIWDITCSSVILGNYLKENGWDCQIISREVFDKHKCSEGFENYNLVPGRARRFIWEIIKSIFTFRPNLIILRQNFQILPYIKLFAPFTPVILQFHGEEIRHCKKFPWQTRLAATMIVSTRDLIKWGPFFSTPIHPMFKEASPGVREKGNALYIRGYLGDYDRLAEAKEFARVKNLELTVIDRTKDEHIPYYQMAEVLQKHEWYLDLKGLTSKDVLSKTAIEFLHTTSSESPGKVLTDTGEIVTSDALHFYVTPLSEYLKLVESFVTQ